MMSSILFIGAVHAQDRKISGTVTSAEDGSPLSGVSVVISGTNVGTQTNQNGHYSLTVPSGSKLIQFRIVGFQTRELTLGSSSVLDAVLDPTLSELDEVVVNTGYMAQSKKEVTGSISQIRGDQFENQGIVNFQQAVQGRVSGVNVTANNGIPGGAISMLIRGSGSFTAGSEPLYIVDGVQMNASTYSGYTQSNTLAGLNPNDIESIEIIKDAATASIYGAQAANGVVLITTKRGKAGKTNIDFNTYVGASEAIKKYDVLNTQEYYQLRHEALANANPRASESAIRNAVLNEIRQPNDLTDAEIAALPTYDWQNEAFRTGLVRNYELSASGGGDKTRFYLSGSYNKQEAIVTKADFTRMGFKVNLDHDYNEKLSFNTSLNLSSLGQLTPFAIDGSYLGNPAFSGPLMIPAVPIYNEDGSFFGMPGSGQTVPGILNQNIIGVNEYNSGDQRTNQLLGALGANYKITKNLAFRSQFSLEYYSIVGKSYLDPRTPDGLTHNGLAQALSLNRSNFQTTQTLTYGTIIDENHKIDAVAGFDYRYDQARVYSLSGRGFPSYLFRNIGAAAEPYSVSESWGGNKIARYFARASYGYKGRYMLNASLSYNGSSRFGTDNLWGWFPGVGVAWNIADESFLHNATWIEDLKLRVGYGQTGNDRIGNFDARSLYSQSGVYMGQPGIAPAGLANPALRWEKNATTDIAVDYGFFRNRIHGTLVVFLRQSRDLLLAQPLLSTSGFTEITTNIGGIDNRGIEFEINTVNVDTDGGFKWTSNFNFTYIRNKITELYGGHEQLPTNVSLRVGHSRNAIFTYQYAGA